MSTVFYLRDGIFYFLIISSRKPYLAELQKGSSNDILLKTFRTLYPHLPEEELTKNLEIIEANLTELGLLI